MKFPILRICVENSLEESETESTQVQQSQSAEWEPVVKQGRIHGVISRVLLGRGNNITDSLQR